MRLGVARFVCCLIVAANVSVAPVDAVTFGASEATSDTIKIWRSIDLTETPVYENRTDQQLGRGSIVIHK